MRRNSRKLITRRFISACARIFRYAGKKFAEARSGRVLTTIIVLACAFVLTACPPKQKKPYKRLPAEAGTQPAKEPSVEKPKVPAEEVRTNARPSTADVATPQRQASMRLVERGQGFLDSKDYQRAAGAFQDAVNVDASNGVAYYYLAVAEGRMGETGVAEGLLDKAEAQLGADEEWMGRINDLRSELGLSVSKPVVPSPIDEAF